MNQLKRALLERSLAYWLGKSAELTDSTLATFQQEQAILQNLICDALSDSAYLEQAAQLLLTLQPLIERRGIASQWLSITQQAQSSFTSQTVSFWHVSVFVGYLHYLQHDWLQSRHQLEPIVTSENAPLLAQADAAITSARCSTALTSSRLLKTYAQQARTRYEQFGASLASRKLATTASQQALIASKQQQTDSAEIYFQTAVQLWENAADATYIARTLNNWAEMYLLIRQQCKPYLC